MPTRHENQRNQQERDKLVLQYQHLPVHVVDKMCDKNITCPYILGRDDAVQIGFLALIRAAEIWRENDKASFMTYAYLSIWRLITDESIKKRKSTLDLSCSLFAIFDGDQQEQGSWVPTVEDVDPGDRLDVIQAYKKLPRRTQDILYHTDMLGKKYETIGNKYNITRERVRQIRNKTLKWLRVYLDGGNPAPLRDYTSAEFQRKQKDERKRKKQECSLCDTKPIT